MKLTRVFSVLITLLLILSFPAFSEPDLNSEASIIINSRSGQILYSNNHHFPMFPASTTKILTAIIILDDLELNEVITIDPQSPYAGGSHIALEPGEEVTVEQLLYALMIASGNDAAEALARYHSGTLEKFTEVMNERAVAMGTLNSNFENPHGLHDKDHVSTAYDLAMISKYAMQNDTFRKIVATRRYEIPPTNVKTETRYLNSTNSLFHGIAGSTTKVTLNQEQIQTAYEFADGIKRGYTPEANFCFVGSATMEDNRQFISVVLNSQSAYMYQDTRLLFDYAYAHTSPVVFAKGGDIIESITLNTKKETTVNGVVENDLSLDLPVDTDPEKINRKVIWKDSLELPLNTGEIIGQVEYYMGETLLVQMPLVSDDSYIGENLIDDVTFYYSQDAGHFSLYLIKGLIALLMWRTIMTIIRLKRKKKLDQN